MRVAPVRCSHPPRDFCHTSCRGYQSWADAIWMDKISPRGDWRWTICSIYRSQGMGACSVAHQKREPAGHRRIPKVTYNEFLDIIGSIRALTYLPKTKNWMRPSYRSNYTFLKLVDKLPTGLKWSCKLVHVHGVKTCRSLWWYYLFLQLSEHSCMIPWSSHSNSSASPIQLRRSYSPDFHSLVHFRPLFVGPCLSSFIWSSLSFLLTDTCFVCY